MRNVYIVHSDYAYINLFAKLGFAATSDIKQADLICFTGGEDVSPELYAAQKHPATYNNYMRDAYEQEVFLFAKEAEIPMVGICRGAQFLNVMNGGEMYQHVAKHTRSHSITDLQTGEIIYVSSTHHQMMKPSPKGLLVASSTLHGEREWYEGEIFKKDVSNQDNEVVFYEETNSLCFQPHPEFVSEEYKGMQNYFDSLLDRFIFKTVTHQFDCAC